MQIPAAWTTHTAPGSRWRLIFFVALLLVCAATAFIGVVPVMVFGHDTFFLLDNGWRLWCGQRPHADYFSATGPVTYLMTWLGFLLSNASPNGIGYGDALAALLIGLWAWHLGYGRLPAAFRALYALYLALLAAAPYVVGTLPLLSSHAMVYNRYGYALAGLVVLECVQPVEDLAVESGEMLGGLSTGAALGLALFTKISYFGVCLPLVALSIGLRGLSRRRLAGLALGFGGVTLALLAFLRFDVRAVLHDFRIAAYGRSRWMEVTSSRVQDKLVWSMPALAALVVALVCGEFRRRGTRDPRPAVVLWGLLIFAADLLLLLGNLQPRGLPIVGAFAIVVAAALSAFRQAPNSHGRGARFAVAATLCALLCGPQFCADIAGLINGAAQRAHPDYARSPVRFTSPRLRPVILYDWAEPKRANGSVYTACVNDGAALLQRYCVSSDRVLTMDLANPFPYALGWPPAHGGMAATAPNNLFTAAVRPTDAEYFGDATAVMVPKDPALERQFFDEFYRVYEPGLMKRYRFAGESADWRLYKLK